ncbi:cuticle protein AMP1A-like [Panulirus ornatus]|uniref:cuticle protein AMP1A-like n=1 Tax=Panulirus ornatus TaxID=150431 RepID=UPI003A86D989
MKVVILAALIAVAFAAPKPEYDHDTHEVAIVRDDRVHEEDGTYSVDVESEDGISLSESGSPAGPEGSIVSAGEFSYTAPDGTPVHVTWVANEDGFQPQSDLLPVAPEFPHEIPQFVLDQIEFAAAEDAARARGDDSFERSYGAL